ncbi:MBL fold metallo-hydrolase [Agromyces sp. Marseille-Q5079]|uniref:MBL fold metallo-hydrolase n=1 Tax=Agromyces sp. Marseille-Q5079 TaxID=3439059 RepID=UPI003D9CA724
MPTWTIVAPGVHQLRIGGFDLSVVVIEGDDGLLVVDSGGDPEEGEEILDLIRSRFDRPIIGLVNTHAHFDHTFGNQAFGPGSATDAAIHGHVAIERHFARYEGPRVAAWREDHAREPERRWEQVGLVAPTHPVARLTRLDPGGRVVELRPQPEAHTDTDLVLFLPAERVWILGDLVEESGPPMYGSGSYPLGWPDVLEALVAEMRPDDLVVPGHGAVVDAAFVARQAAQLRLIAERLTAAHAAGLDATEALAAHEEWPFPTAGLAGAVERAYATLDGLPLDQGSVEDA